MKKITFNTDNENAIYVIWSGRKWKVIKRNGGNKALRVFKYRELAFKYATEVGNRVIVMTEDAFPLFIYENGKVINIVKNKQKN